MSDYFLFTSDSNRYKEMPLALDGMGLYHIQEPVIRARGIKLYQWVQSIEGCGRVQVGRQSYLVPKGYGMYIPPGTIHEYYAVDGEWMTNFLCFNGKLAKEIMETLGFSEFMVHALANPQLIIDREQEIYDLYQSQRPQKAYEASKMLYQLVMDLALNVTDSALSFQEDANPKILQAARYMEEHFSEQITLADVAEAVGLSREYFCSVFKKTVGTTAMEYLLIIRMGHAKTFLLQYPEKKVKEIAEMTGFADCSYFCSVFKKQEHYTPAEFRCVRK